MRLWILYACAGLALAVSIWQLEAERHSVDVSMLKTAKGEISLYTSDVADSGPIVVVTHGFAGSRQMMQYISRDLARAGYRVAAFDFYGHGRNPSLMSPDVTRIEGTTQQLVDQTLYMVGHLRQEFDLTEGVALLGHSMATDIVIRASQSVSETKAVVAISMYSDLVSASFPERLLILSGEWEHRLREGARAAVALVSGHDQGKEGATAVDGSVVRRAVAVPNTEHVAVLFSPRTLSETRVWLDAAFDREIGQSSKGMGGYIISLLAMIVVLTLPISRVVPQQVHLHAPLSMRQFFLALVAPVLPAVASSQVFSGGVLGMAAFGGLLAFLAVWGAVVLALFAYWGRLRLKFFVLPVILLLVWSLGVFALALDRYGAAFVPTGPRLAVMAALCFGTIPFMVGDRLITCGAKVWQRILARILPVSVLAGAMALLPQNMGLLFTVLPVMVLFFLAFGTIARPFATRIGAESTGVAQGVVLAWSIAASTPLFAG